MLGLILFCGLLISVISICWNAGLSDIVKAISFTLANHIVIIGFDNMVPTLIQQICDDTLWGAIFWFKLPTNFWFKKSVAKSIRNWMPWKIVVLRARRDSIELENSIHRRASIPYRRGTNMTADSLNIDCLKDSWHSWRCNKCSSFTVFRISDYFAAFNWPICLPNGKYRIVLLLRGWAKILTGNTEKGELYWISSSSTVRQ